MYQVLLGKICLSLIIKAVVWLIKSDFHTGVFKSCEVTKLLSTCTRN